MTQIEQDTVIWHFIFDAVGRPHNFFPTFVNPAQQVTAVMSMHFKHLLNGHMR